MFMPHCGRFFSVSFFQFSSTTVIRVSGIHLLTTSETVSFLCSVCCNLGDVFNVLQCCLICMLACSNGLQHCSSMPH